MKFRPLHDRVVVRRIDAEEKTKGGIIIPDTAKEKPQEGEIIAVGEAYESRSAAQKGVESVKKNAPTAEIREITSDKT